MSKVSSQNHIPSSGYDSVDQFLAMPTDPERASAEFEIPEHPVFEEWAEEIRQDYYKSYALPVSQALSDWRESKLTEGDIFNIDGSIEKIEAQYFSSALETLKYHLSHTLDPLIEKLKLEEREDEVSDLERYNLKTLVDIASVDLGIVSGVFLAPEQRNALLSTLDFVLQIVQPLNQSDAIALQYLAAELTVCEDSGAYVASPFFEEMDNTAIEPLELDDPQIEEAISHFDGDVIFVQQAEAFAAKTLFVFLDYHKDSMTNVSNLHDSALLFFSNPLVGVEGYEGRDGIASDLTDRNYVSYLVSSKQMLEVLQDSRTLYESQLDDFVNNGLPLIEENPCGTLEFVMQEMQRTDNLDAVPVVYQDEEDYPENWSDIAMQVDQDSPSNNSVGNGTCKVLLNDIVGNQNLYWQEIAGLNLEIEKLTDNIDLMTTRLKYSRNPKDTASLDKFYAEASLRTGDEDLDQLQYQSVLRDTYDRDIFGYEDMYLIDEFDSALEDTQQERGLLAKIQKNLRSKVSLSNMLDQMDAEGKNVGLMWMGAGHYDGLKLYAAEHTDTNIVMVYPQYMDHSVLPDLPEHHF